METKITARIIPNVMDNIFSNYSDVVNVKFYTAQNLTESQYLGAKRLNNLVMYDLTIRHEKNIDPKQLLQAVIHTSILDKMEAYLSNGNGFLFAQAPEFKQFQLLSQQAKDEIIELVVQHGLNKDMSPEVIEPLMNILNPKSTENENIEVIGGPISEIALRSAKDPFYLLTFDNNTQKIINNYIAVNDIHSKLTSKELLNLSDYWAEEISHPTKLSKGMSIDQRDQKSAHFYRMYEKQLVNEINHEDPKMEEKKESSLLKQYNSIKERYPDAVILFRVGDYYEVLGDDAKKVSEVLGITLTERNTSEGFQHLAGFPAIQANDNINKLVKAGLKAALCDSLESPVQKIQDTSNDYKTIFRQSREKKNDIPVYIKLLDKASGEHFSTSHINVDNWMQTKDLIREQIKNLRNDEELEVQIATPEYSFILNQNSTAKDIFLKIQTAFDIVIQNINKSLTNNINNQNPNIMENTQQQQDHDKQISELQIGMLGSAIIDNSHFKGTISKIDGDTITLQNLKGETFNAPRDKIYQFFSGQKYDFEEIKNLFFKKMGGLEFKDITKPDMIRLMRGEMTNSLFTGVSNKEGQEAKEYQFKVRPEYNSETKQLELQPYFKKGYELSEKTKVFGVELTADQVSELKEGKSITLERTSKTGADYSAKFHYDADLNDVIFDKFVNSESMEKKVKEEKIPAQDRPDYPDWLLTVGMFDNASKVNIHQLNKVGLVLDGYKLEEFLTDFGLEQDQIDKVASVSDWLSKDGDVTGLKNDILTTINSSAEKVDLFKEKFNTVGQQQQQQIKR